MRAVVQRVKEAEVKVNGKITGKIDKGLVAFIGISKDDNFSDVEYIANKILNLRILEDENGKMNLSVLDQKQDILVISQFTLYGEVKKGLRPNFQEAAKPDFAVTLYNLFVEKLRESKLKIEEGVFQAMMEVKVVNDGPVTIIIDSKKIL